MFNSGPRFAEHGLAGLRSGPLPGSGPLLDAAQEAEIGALICRGMPEEWGLPFALGSRPAVRALIVQRRGVRLAVRTRGTYRARRGFTAQKPPRRAWEQRPDAVQRWLEQD